MSTYPKTYCPQLCDREHPTLGFNGSATHPRRQGLIALPSPIDRTLRAFHFKGELR